MRKPAGAYALGVEVLLGLLLGAAAIASLISLMLTLLVQRDLAVERASRGDLLAVLAATRLPEFPTEESLTQIVSPSIISGDIAEARLIDQARADSFQAEGWSVALSEQGAAVALRIPGRGALPGILTAGLALLAAIVLLLVALTPAFLSRSVTGPLRAILKDIDRYMPGSSALTAKSSFGDLIRKLSDRDRELARLRAEAEHRADEAEERSSAVVSSFRSAVLALDASANLTLWNPSAAGLFGLEPEDSGRAFPSGRNAASKRLGGIIESSSGDGCPSDFEMELDAGAQTRVYSVSIAGSRSGARAVLATDVTPFRTMERRLAEEAAMAGLGAVSAGVAHEMGNTLCALSGFIDLLARGHSDPRTMSILSEARLEIESALRMIASFKGLAAPGEDGQARISVLSAVESCVAVCAETGAGCRIDAEAVAGEVVADPVLIQRCLLNLVRNAREAGPDKPVEVSAGVEGSELVFRVADRGPGLGATLEVLGQPFFSTKKGSGHMGMGLAISRRITALLGGSLRAADREGGGAVFELRLPLVTSDNGG
jgi:signal transduction histidine kinase